MSKNPLSQSAELYEYIKSVSVRENSHMIQLRERTATISGAGMQISPDQGQFMGMLVKLMGAKRILEIGTFTGYSALCMATALPEDGRLIACDLSREWTDIAYSFWVAAGVDHKIDLRIAPAIDTLDALISEGQNDAFDIAFIDADKPNYDHYYEKSLILLRSGGVVLIDNVFWGGKVIDADDNSESTESLRALNAKISKDERVETSMIAIGDGLFIVRKL